MVRTRLGKTQQTCEVPSWVLSPLVGLKLGASVPSATLIPADVTAALCDFHQQDCLKKATAMRIAAVLPGRKLKQLGEAFLRMDRDGDGQVSIAEMELALRSLDVDAGTAREVAASLDLDQNGFVEWSEFEEIGLRKERLSPIGEEQTHGRRLRTGEHDAELTIVMLEFSAQ